MLGVLAAGCAPARRDPAADGGSWRPGTLEIHHFDVGQADATLIVAPGGRSLLIDVGEARWDDDAGARTVADGVRAVLGCSCVDQVLITHMHVDHVGYPGQGGLWRLVNGQGFTIGQTFHRDFDRFRGDSAGTIDRWRAYFDGEGADKLHPTIVREGSGQIDLGPEVSFRVVAVDGHGQLRPGDFRADRAPPNENDYSVAALLRFGQLDYFIGGDLSGQWSQSPYGYSTHDVETSAARGLPDVDVLRVSHHGSDHSSGPTLLAQIAPEVTIVSAGDGNPYGHPAQATVDRLRARSVLYLTERGAPSTNVYDARIGGPIVLRSSDGLTYWVNGDRFQATDPPRVDGDGDGYFREADPDDGDASIGPAARGGCDPLYQNCSGS